MYKGTILSSPYAEHLGHLWSFPVPWKPLATKAKRRVVSGIDNSLNLGGWVEKEKAAVQWLIWISRESFDLMVLLLGCEQMEERREDDDGSRL
jgi:hypothetical protein